MSLISDLPEESSNSKILKTSDSESPLSEKINFEKQTSGNFFDEVGIVFSTLGSLFDFLN